ncbi:MAG: putative porin [Psychroserpens sp.]|nr:putative porin [Psychroserpens sp.]
MKRIVLLYILFFGLIGFAQNPDKRLQVQNQTNSGLDTSSVAKTKNSGKDIYQEKAKIEQYLIVSKDSDTTYVDTTLTIQKDYKFNYLRKDNFGLMQFANIGQTYNSLTPDFSNRSTLPIFGARARHFNYMEADDINYYYVPTPLTELFFKTAFQQGQVLDAFFTVNTSPQFNFSIAYKGLRSLGNYQHALTSTGNFRVTFNYHTKDKRYKARAHIVTQDLLNQENGGLTDDEVLEFASGDEDFLDRAVFDAQFQDAESILVGKRVYLDHHYEITKPKDSSDTKLLVGQIISFEDRYYEFNQDRANEFLGEAFVSRVRDRSTLENFYNRIYVDYTNLLGQFQFNADYTDYNYGYNSVTVLDNQVIPNRIKDRTFSLGASYNGTIGKFNINGEIQTNITGEFNGSLLRAKANYQFNEDLSFNAGLKVHSSAANYNFLLYKSDYINYNWYNFDAFDNVNTQQILFKVVSDKYVDLSLELTNIENYTYFARSEIDKGVKPFQSGDPINLFKIRLDKEIVFGKFALDNTILYQNVTEGEGVLNLPEIVTRNTLYYSNSFFKNALSLQTGVTLNYFTSYNMNAYDPLLAEFYVQNDQSIGDFPRLDFFVNAKVRQTRIYLKAEHFNAAFTGYDYFSAPNVPYRDFAVRFGIVWNFFL